MRNKSAIAHEFIKNGKSETCPIIDMHGHYGPYGWLYFPRPYAGDMLHSMESAGVKAIVCSSHMAIFHDATRGNKIMEEVICKNPGKIFGYWAINPNYPQMTASVLKEFDDGKKNKKGFLGFKFLSDYHKCPITDCRYTPVLEYADANKLCVLMHTWGYSPFDGPKLVKNIAGKYRNVTFIMGHSGYGEWDRSLAVAAEFQNVFLELTAVYATHEGIELKWCPERDFGIGVNGIIEKMVEVAGSEKILFGTDLPWYSPHYAAGSIVFARIADNDMHNIFHRNAEEIFAKSGIKL